MQPRSLYTCMIISSEIVRAWPSARSYPSFATFALPARSAECATAIASTAALSAAELELGSAASAAASNAGTAIICFSSSARFMYPGTSERIFAFFAASLSSV